MKSEIIVGTVEGTGSNIYVCIGFQPEWVELFNIDGNASLFWTEDMGDGYGVKDKAQAVNEGGTSTYTVGPQKITSGGVSKYEGGDSGSSAYVDKDGTAISSSATTPEGFQIGTDSDINVSGETIVWRAGRAWS